MNLNYTDVINLNAQIIDIDNDEKRIILSYNNSPYLLEINEAFEDSFNHIKSLYKSNKTFPKFFRSCI